MLNKQKSAPQYQIFFATLPDLYNKIERALSKLEKKDITTRKLADYCYYNVEKTLIKTFLTELKENTTYNETLSDFSNVLKYKYQGLLLLVNRQCSAYLTLLNNIDAHLTYWRMQEKIEGKIILNPVGDLHQSTLVCELFHNGNRFFYKPREAQNEKILSAIIQEFQRWSKHKVSGLLRTLECCVIQDYGDFSIHSALNESPGTQKESEYLIALLCALGARDMHYGNFIESENGIYPVDVETLFSPGITWLREFESYNPLSSLLFPVISTMGVDLSLIGFTQAENAYYLYKPINLYSNNMDLVKRKEKIFNNIIRVNFSFDKFLTAYQEVRTFIRKRQGWLTHLFSTYKDSSSRVIFRSTHLYGKLIHSMSHPAVCKKIEDIDSYLYRQLKRHNISTAFIPEEVIYSEISQLKNFNIPRFTCKNNETLLISTHYQQSFNGVAPFAQCLSAHTVQSIKNQLQLIKGALYCDAVNKGITSTFKGGLLHTSRRISLYSFLYDGIFYSAVYLEKFKKWSYQRVNSSLYGGTLGILLGIHNKDDNFTAMILNKNLLKNKKLSHGFSNVGGALYALDALSQEISTANYDSIKSFIILCLDHLVINRNNNNRYEFLNGIAGTIYCVATCRSLNAEQKKYYLQAFSMELYQKALKKDVMPLFSNELPYPQSGLAHGFSGISLAFIAMYLITGSANMAEMALNFLALEENHFKYNRYSDLRPRSKGNDEPINGWCTGSTGVLLTKLLISRYLNMDLLTAMPISEIAVAIKNTWRYKSPTICHGIISDYEVLRYIESKYYLNLISDRDEEYFRERISNETDTDICFSPGYMNGLAGLKSYRRGNRLFLLGLECEKT